MIRLVLHTRSRLLCLASLCLAASAGCGVGTGVRMQISSTGNVTADSIKLSVFDKKGRVINGAELGPTTKLPGDVMVLLSPDAGEARAVALAYKGGTRVGFAIGRVAIEAGQEASLGLQIQPGAMPDRDGDDVPDTIDNCPNVSNPEQTSTSGDD